MFEVRGKPFPKELGASCLLVFKECSSNAKRLRLLLSLMIALSWHSYVSSKAVEHAMDQLLNKVCVCCVCVCVCVFVFLLNSVDVVCM